MPDVIPPADDLPFTLQPIKDVMVVEFRAPSLMDAVVLDKTGQRLYHLIEKEDRRKIILDFSSVQYVSSQAIGIIVNMNKKLGALKGKMILCGIGPRLQELLRITRLDKVLVIKPTQSDAEKVFLL
jgi:anti-sigma B factor antagonist